MLLAGALCAAGAMNGASSEAALVTRSYEGSVDFASSPAGLVTFEFTLTFDTDADTIDRAVDSYWTSSALAGFNPASVIFTRRKLLPADPFYNVSVGGAAAGAEAAFGIDFAFKFVDLPTSPAVGIYGDGSGFDLAHTGSARIISTSTPLPEPAAWTMMLIGFGIIGAAMRSGGRTQRRATA